MLTQMHGVYIKRRNLGNAAISLFQPARVAFASNAWKLRASVNEITA